MLVGPGGTNGPPKVVGIVDDRPGQTLIVTSSFPTSTIVAVHYTTPLDPPLTGNAKVDPI